MCYDSENNLILPKDGCMSAEDLGNLGIGYESNYNHIDTREQKSYFDETNRQVGIDSFYNYFGVKKPENIIK